ncbi:putative zinc-containing alcohol dehydrogenase [Arthrobacter globiformis NBRC 12137]|uniref:Putative zinc-containing alcohol dehydrogenase n=1 Tax=Arthrobacter globiformis (strain ATCC 8010 / DSM 20124 / JCM 1332 / NBRC 12137 / NCIMB 8907 / NRRL B-2979 / 168) TaxID=1077972 RepID=H0QK17_ARTG1|nr:putative zinc-containing alcohol dehydrogenase [Arthrobacter globiformis NBRC 12137]
MKFKGAGLETGGAPRPWDDTTSINVAELTLDAPAPANCSSGGKRRGFATRISREPEAGQTVTVGLPRPDVRIELSPLSLVLEAKVTRQIVEFKGSAS